MIRGAANEENFQKSLEMTEALVSKVEQPEFPIFKPRTVLLALPCQKAAQNLRDNHAKWQCFKLSSFRLNKRWCGGT